MSQRYALCARLSHLTSSAFTRGVPTFLAPALAGPNGLVQLQSLQFSTSAQLFKRQSHRSKRDTNPNRGVSALRRTGLRNPVSMSKFPLPKPVLSSHTRPKPTVDENHGLWGFFNEQRTTLSTPQEDKAHGNRTPRLPGPAID